MMNQLFITLKYSSTMVIILFMTVPVGVNSTEYVFSAPPETEAEMVEIPTQEADYPFYECDQETSKKAESETANQDNNTDMDSHECDCVDCQKVTPEVKQPENYRSDNQPPKIMNNP